MIVVFEGDEAKWLQNSVFRFASGLEDLRHGFDGARFCLDSDLDQIALLEGPGQSQHAAGLGNRLQLGSRAVPVSQFDHNRDRASELNSLSAVLRVSLGEVCHIQDYYGMSEEHMTDYGSRLSGFQRIVIESLYNQFINIGRRFAHSPKGFGQSLYQIGCDQGMLAHAFARHVARKTVKMNGSNDCFRDALRILRDETGDHAG